MLALRAYRQRRRDTAREVQTTSAVIKGVATLNAAYERLDEACTLLCGLCT